MRRRLHWTWVWVFAPPVALILLAIAVNTFHCLPLGC